MNKNKIMCMTALLFAGSVFIVGTSSKAQTACTNYSVSVPILPVQKDPNTPGDYITTLQQGDIACISDAPQVGPQKFGFVVSQSSGGGTPVPVNGWASVIFMTQQEGAAVAPSAPASTTTPSAPAESTTIAAAPVAEPAASDILTFDHPVPYGSPPVRGKTLKQLIEGKPLFPPLEGLPENLWKKTCSSCHQWNAELLCEQGGSYLSKAAEIFRHQHPYGGPYKLALMRWAKTGCN
jgi:hypothetical protein